MAEWIVGFIEEYGCAAVALLMLAENVFPPIPSELIMPFAGFAASDGKIDPWLVAIAEMVRRARRRGRVAAGLIDWISKAILGAIAVWYLWRVVRGGRR